MNADLEAAIAEGRRRMKQFEERTSHQLDMFDKEVDKRHHMMGHKYSNISKDLKPVSWPLWGVVLENDRGERFYKDHVSFDLVSKFPRRCACLNHLNGCQDEDTWQQNRNFDDEPVLTRQPEETIDSLISVETKTLMMGRRWGLNKYLYDEEYVSNPPYGIIMKKPAKPEPEPLRAPFSEIEQHRPNTKLVSQYWRRKWKIPADW